MKNSSVWEIGKYTIKDERVFNKEKEIKRTVKGYTIGYWLNGKFRSLNWINKNAKKKNIECPF